MRKVIIITSIVLVLFLVLAFFIPVMIGLAGSTAWILRGALWLLGIAAAGLVLWFVYKKKKAEEEAEYNEAGASDTDDISQIVKEAETKLPKMAGFPAIFLIGDPGSAKTSTIVNSGLDAELLAGQVYQDRNVIPTRAANVWYAQKALFVEAAGRTTAETGSWAKLAKRLQPGRLGAVVSQKDAPRAALLAIEAESLIRPGATEALAVTARQLRSRLGEISQALGINLPVYVLFTKSDRIPFFAEYVRNLTNEEASQVLGVTVPLRSGSSGVYAEEETARLTGVFEQLFRSLCNFRPPFLSREHEPTKLPGIYEFPREFRKLRPTLVQFLVDLCRPSQLTVGPFLRGFYFSGVRPIVINDVAPAPAASAAKAPDGGFGATGAFRTGPGGAVAPMVAQVVGTKKVPQWVFLSHFFHDLLLADHVAMGASGASTKTSLLRRVLLGTLAGLLLLYCIALIVSYSKNHALETRVQQAARGIETVDSSGAKPATLDSLQRLEALRQSLAVLTTYKREGSPTSYHWGLYVGDRLYPDVKKIYFESFRRVLLGQTQATMVDSLKSLPAAPPGPEYSPTYDTLKAYLITTSNHDKSTKAFLSPVLLNRWSANKNIDLERQALAQKQFDFYSDELKLENPFSSENDSSAVTTGRRYLNQFAGVERVYAAMIAEVAKTTTPINFNKKYPGSAEAVIDNYDVYGPFTKPGWDAMHNLMKNPEQFFAGEKWVLGETGAAANIDRATLVKQISDKYNGDYIKQWANYLKAASVVKYANLQDASKKLTLLSSSGSPLLELFSLGSQNTKVDQPEVAKVFQPLDQVTPAGSGDRLIGPNNQPYMNALLTLQTAVDAAAQAPQLNDQVAAPTLQAATAARVATRQVAQAFVPGPERVEAMTQKLMEDPITHVEALIKRFGPEELNAKGKDLCGQYKKLYAKYPFNSNTAAPQATVADVNGIFKQPDGALWAFYNTSLAKLLPKQGNDYVPATGGTTNLTPGFVAWFKRQAAFSDVLYAGNSPDPHFTYTLKPLPSEGIQGLDLNIDGQTLTYKVGGDTAGKQFVWQGSGVHGAKASVNMGGPNLGWSNSEGLWAVFQFFAQAEHWQPSGQGNSLEWVVRTGKNPVTLPSGSPVIVKFELDMGATPPVFQKGYFSNMGCVAEVAK